MGCRVKIMQFCEGEDEGTVSEGGKGKGKGRSAAVLWVLRRHVIKMSLCRRLFRKVVLSFIRWSLLVHLPLHVTRAAAVVLCCGCLLVLCGEARRTFLCSYVPYFLFLWVLQKN